MKFPRSPSAWRYLRPPPRRYSQHLEKVIPASAGFGAIEWVLSRPLYRFARFNFKAVPKAKRAAALQLQVRPWSPYPATGQYVSWDGDEALVWAWDAERLAAALRDAKLTPSRVNVLPETVLHAPQTSGLHLVSCLDGFEAQIWRNHQLTHSRWWPVAPSAAEWRNFQRDAALAPAEQVTDLPAAPQSAAWQLRPWCRPAGLGELGADAFRTELLPVTAGAVILAAFTLWHGTQLIKIHQAYELHGSELRALEQRARPILEARREALDALGRAQMLQAYDRFPDQLTLLAGITRRLPKGGTYLKEWEYRNGKLKLMIAFPSKSSTSEVVQSLQLAGWFANVQAVADNDPASLTLSMDVLPWAEANPPLSAGPGRPPPGKPLKTEKVL